MDTPCCFCIVYKNKCIDCRYRIDQHKIKRPNATVKCTSCHQVKPLSDYLITQTLPQITHRIRCKQCWKDSRKQDKSFYCECCDKTVVDKYSHIKSKRHLAIAAK